MRITNKDISVKIDSLLAKPLTESEQLYVKSFQEFYNKKNYLSEKQYAFLLTLEDRYSAEKIQKSIDWISSFDQEKRDRLTLACEYYKHTPYFTDLVTKVLRTPDYIPSEKQYNSMCYNKYFERALEYYKMPPKFALADIVVFRANKRTSHRDKTMVYMIEGINEKPSFTKCGRVYKLMVLGTEDSISVFEDEIKLHREKKSKNEN